MRRLPRFGEAHPEIDIRLQASVNRIDLGQGIGRRRYPLQSRPAAGRRRHRSLSRRPDRPDVLAVARERAEADPPAGRPRRSTR